jgi:hypothetical protein
MSTFNNAVTLALALGGLYLWRNYYGRDDLTSPLESNLPLHKTINVARWRHDGTQPVHERIGNSELVGDYPEVERTLASIS